MHADLFKPSDAAALLAIRAAMQDGSLRGDALLAAFQAAGLMQARGADRAALGKARVLARGVAQARR